MTDLVERLHTAGREVPSGGNLLHAAANRIQWLEAERDELSQLAAQANKRIEQLEASLRKANSQFEHFEREWYLRGDRIEALERENAELESKLAKAEHDLFHANNKIESMTKVKNFMEWGGL